MRPRLPTAFSVMQHAVKSCDMDVVEDFVLVLGYSPCTHCPGQGNDFESIPTVRMEIRYPVKGSFSSEFPRSIIVAELRQREVTSRRIFLQKFRFLEKRPVAVKFSKFCFERIHRLTDRCIVCKFREIWQTGNQ